jgi:hypothetical protein
VLERKEVEPQRDLLLQLGITNLPPKPIICNLCSSCEIVVDREFPLSPKTVDSTSLAICLRVFDLHPWHFLLAFQVEASPTVKSPTAFDMKRIQSKSKGLTELEKTTSELIPFEHSVVDCSLL